MADTAVLLPSATVVPAYGGWSLQVRYSRRECALPAHRTSGTLIPLTKDVFRRQYLPRNIHFCDDGASVLMTYIENHEV